MREGEEVGRAGRWGRRALVGALFAAAAAAACGGSPTSPPVPAAALTLEAKNYVQESRGGASTSESESVLFRVYAEADMRLEDLAQIQTMTVRWPDGATRTPVTGGFGGSAGHYVAAVAVTPSDGLVPGTYVLEVDFKDGQKVTRELTYDGSTLGTPSVSVLTPSISGVSVTWSGPAVAHQWALTVKSADRQTTLATGPWHQTSGGTVTGWVNAQLAPGMSYVLGLALSDDFNSRFVTMPFTVPS